MSDIHNGEGLYLGGGPGGSGPRDLLGALARMLTPVALSGLQAAQNDQPREEKEGLCSLLWD